MNRLFTRILPFIFICLAFAGTASAQIYADVALGGAVSGTFTIHLEYQKAPAAVANFIGLATGSKGWLDLNTGSIQYTPFYNGLTFHRVIADFMSQTGSRNGRGTDGPGYTFQNEIDPTLTHATHYTVGMANSGGAHSNGSQWYVTGTTDQSALNGSYTIFGTVTSGTAICDALNHVTTTSGSDSGGAFVDRPVTPVTIRSIVIRGPSLAGFNLTPNALPKVLNAQPVMKVSGSAFSLGFDHHSYSDYRLFDSPNLTTWTESWSNYYHTAAPLGGDLDVTTLSIGSKHFFRLARVDYSLCFNHFVPNSLAGKTLHFGDSLGGTLVVNADQTAETWANDGFGSNALSYFDYSVSMVPYENKGTLTIQFQNGMVYQFDRLEYTSATGGTYSGQVYGGYYGTTHVAFSGTFTSAP